jgi:hypothetical protein
MFILGDSVLDANTEERRRRSVFTLFRGGVIGTRIHIPCTLISNRQQL